MNRYLERDVLVDFLLTFARSEFALKTGGFWKCGGRRGIANEAHADWDAFIRCLSGRFGADGDLALNAACERLLDAPPWELVVIDGRVVWQQRSQASSGDLAADALTAVKRLRNNLFHGNEASAVQGYVASHTEQFLRDAIRVLATAVNLVPDVKAAYESATL
jgi:hypothetical protein